jgi:glycosyltransferase involved in cell wall biosynthesis
MMSDICLILEGTYPYLNGGVSRWTHTLLKLLNEFSFSIVHLYDGSDGPSRRVVFEVPSNVDMIVEIDIKDGIGFRFNFSDLLDRIPDSRIYHSLSTGFAGLLGLELKLSRGRPFILTEHGLYWKELEFGVNEIECGFKIIKNEVEHRRLCIAWREYQKIFLDIARRCYINADFITTVCEHNMMEQMSILSNVDREIFRIKSRVINNFVDISKFRAVRRRGINRGISLKNVSFIGRVVPIKDVVTFIRAIPEVLDKLPYVKFFIVGDTDQDREYFNECTKLIEELGVEGVVFFTGDIDVREHFRVSDILVLPSLSEAQPFVVLEAMASGVPVIATGVGGVPELILKEGMECGFIFKPGDHVELSRLIIKLLSDINLWNRFSLNGVKRAEHFDVSLCMNTEIYIDLLLDPYQNKINIWE